MSYVIDAEFESAVNAFLQRKGVDSMQSTDLTLTYDRVVGRVDVDCTPVGRSEVVVGPPVRSIARKVTRDLLYKEADELAKVEGYCYLWVVKHRKRSAVRQVLGAYPTMHAVFKALTRDNYDTNAGAHFRVVSKPGNCVEMLHLTANLPTSVYVDRGSFHQLFVASVVSGRVKASLSFSDVEVANGICPVSPTALVGAVHGYVQVTDEVSCNATIVHVPDNIDCSIEHYVQRQSVCDDTVRDTHCTCGMHRPALNSMSRCDMPTQLSDIASVPGQVMYHCCRVTKDVHDDDVAFQSLFEQYKHNDLEPGDVSSIVKQYSSVGASMASFGVGYCYLAYIHYKHRRRVARVLGPNPQLREVYAMSAFVGFPQHVFLSLVVYDGIFCHFSRDVRRDTEALDDLVTSVIEVYPDIRVI